MYCSCGNTHCICEDRCCCCPNLCECSPCIEIRNQHRHCEACGHSNFNDLHAPIHEWTRTGTYPNLDFLSNNPLQPRINETVVRSEMGLSVNEAALNSQRESKMDESLIFQMDDVNSSSEGSTAAFAQPKIKVPTGNQLNANVTHSNPKVMQKSDTIIKDLSRSSQLCSYTAASKSGDTRIIDHHPSVTVLNPEESKVESSIVQDAGDCPQHSTDETILKQDEYEIANTESVTISLPSTDSLPSDLSSLSSDNSSPARISISRSPSEPLSTSAPSVFDVPETFRELETPKQTTCISEAFPKPNLPNVETLRLSDSHPKAKERSESELSSSIEAFPTDISNGTGPVNGHPDLPTISVTASALNNLSPGEVESAKSTTSHISSTAKPFKLPSPETSKQTRHRTSSESSSSIETLAREPSTENFGDEPTKSPKKDN